MTQDESVFLVLLLDTNLDLWPDNPLGSAEYGTAPLEPRAFISQVAAFVSGFLLLHENNRLAAFTIGDRASDLIYEPADIAAISSGDASASGDGWHGAASALMPADALLKGLTDNLARILRDGGKDAETTREPGYSAAFSRAMCYINKAQLKQLMPAGARPRILVISGCPETPAQYVPVMNSAFAAQRAGTPVDMCMVAPAEVSFLQQVSQITGGVFMRPERCGALLQYLLSHFTADGATRALLRTGAAPDTKVPCFCHRTCIDMGFVCSVCLSVFCSKSDMCLTCGAVFAQGRTVGGGTRGGEATKT